MVDLSPEPLRSYMKELIEMRIEDPILPMEEGFGQLLKTHGEDLPDDKFSLFMNAMYSVDAYIRDYFRKAAVDELVRAKIPVRLVGEGWEKYESCNETYVTGKKKRWCLDCRLRKSPMRILLNVIVFQSWGT